jgi:protein-tyrosine phosphatase
VKIVVSDSAGAAADETYPTIFTTPGYAGRRLAWEGLLNARDLGGYPTANGGETRWRAIVRSDSLTTLTERGQVALVEYGVRSIIDLRHPSVVAQYPHPFATAGSHTIRYTNYPFTDPASPHEGEPDTLALLYIGRLERVADRIGAVMTEIANAPDGGVLIHCVGGKDRTGLVAGLLLSLVGVAPETVAADYALSGDYLRSREEEFLRNGPGERAERERLIAKFSPKAEVMLEVLSNMEERHGGAESYLLHAGVSPDDIGRLRRRLTRHAR